VVVTAELVAGAIVELACAGLVSVTWFKTVKPCVVASVVVIPALVVAAELLACNVLV
jgi:hypothetical protein